MLFHETFTVQVQQNSMRHMGKLYLSTISAYSTKECIFIKKVGFKMSFKHKLAKTELKEEEKNLRETIRD